MAFSTEAKVEATPDILHDSGLVAPADLQQAFKNTVAPDASKAAPVAAIAAENTARQTLNKESIQKIDGTLEKIQEMKDPNKPQNTNQPDAGGKFALAVAGAAIGPSIVEPIVGPAIATGMTALSVGSAFHTAFTASTSGSADSRSGDRAREKNTRPDEGVYARNTAPTDPTKGGGTFGVSKDIRAFSRDIESASRTPGGIIERMKIQQASMQGVEKLPLEVQLEDKKALYVRSMQNYAEVKEALDLRQKGIPVDVATAIKTDNPDRNIKFTVPERQPLAFNI